MSASAIIDQATAMGVRLYIEDGRLCCEGEDSVLSALEPSLKAHKAELLVVLSGGRQETVTSRFWRVYYPDRTTKATVYPNMTRAEVIAYFPNAVDAEPIEELSETALTKPANLDAKARQNAHNPELRRKVLQQLRDNPETTYAYVVDNPDTDPVIVGFGIRDTATCELAIPKERFDPLEFLLAVKDMAGTA